MVILCDDRIVGIINAKFGVALDRIIFGKLEVAHNYWIRYNSTTPGTAILPYVAFYRTISFSQESKASFNQKAIVNVSTNSFRNFRMAPIELDYVIEILGDKVVDQVDYIKKYIFWATTNPFIEFTDKDSVVWRFMIVPENPEDNSDLEAEEETGRVVRTTFTFKVFTYMLESTSLNKGIIYEALGKIHLYSGLIDNYSEQIALVDAYV